MGSSNVNRHLKSVYQLREDATTSTLIYLIFFSLPSIAARPQLSTFNIAINFYVCVYVYLFYLNNIIAIIK